jgi:O-antigen/teichoic acid export membrane protein
VQNQKTETESRVDAAERASCEAMERALRWLRLLLAADVVLAAVFVAMAVANARGRHPVVCAIYAAFAALVLSLAVYLAVVLRRLRPSSPPRRNSATTDTYRRVGRPQWVQSIVDPTRPNDGKRRTG